MPYVPPGEESLKEDGWWNAPSPIIGPSPTGPHPSDGAMPIVGPGPSTIGGTHQQSNPMAAWDLFGGLF
jgi:hypothetical protein